MPKKTTDTTNSITESIPSEPVKDEPKVAPVSENASPTAKVSATKKEQPEVQSWLIT